MSQETSLRLADHLQNRAGEHLRSVIRYDRDDYSILYLRDDVAEQYSEEDIDAVVNELFSENFFRSKQEELYEHGRLNCTLRCFTHGVEMHFPHHAPAGTAVALEPRAVEDLYSFIGDCMTVIHAEDDPRTK